MSTPTTLAETWTQAQADAPLDPRATPAVQAKRDYMRGALDCLLLQKAGATEEQLLRECIDFGKAVVTAAERVMQESGFCRAGGRWLHPGGDSISVDTVRALTQAVVSAA